MTHTPFSRTNPSERSASLETLRALACIALVSYHVVGGSSTAGMEVPSEHWLAQINGTFIDMRMPLFSFLSGCVFISLERLTRSPGHVALSKARRLLVPLLSVGLLFWAVGTVMGQAQPPLISLLYMPYAHFWFLQATFIIMTAFVLLHALLPGHSVTLATGLIGVAVLVWVLGLRATPNLFSINQVAYLMPFFMLGYLCAHSRLMVRLKASIPPRLAILTILMLIGSGYALMSGLVPTMSETSRLALGLIIGIVFCLSLSIIAPSHPALVRLGGYSYTIYLFHVFFTAGSFKVLKALAPSLPDALVWITGLTAGLFGPIVLHHILLRSRVLATLFLGLSLRARAGSHVPSAPPVAHISAAQRA